MDPFRKSGDEAVELGLTLQHDEMPRPVEFHQFGIRQ